MKVTGIRKSGVAEAISMFEKYQNTYFWSPPSSASSRRREESKSRSWDFQVDGKPVEVSVKISCSCKNYYATRRVVVGGTSKVQMLPYLRKCLQAAE